MTGHALLSNLFSHCRGILINRVIASFQQPILTLTAETKKHIKAIEIPEPPKKPLTSYFRFLNEHRLLIKQNNPDLKQTDITKQCASDWRNMDIKLKQKYDEAYQKDLVVYNDQHKKYVSSLTSEQMTALTQAKHEKQIKKNRRIMKKLWRETDKPKRPISSYGFFIKEKKMLPENKDTKFRDILDRYKNEWINLTDAQKQKYVEMFKTDQDRYNSEIAKWENKMIKEGKDKIIRKEANVLNSKRKKLTDILTSPITHKKKSQ